MNMSSQDVVYDRNTINVESINKMPSVVVFISEKQSNKREKLILSSNEFNLSLKSDNHDEDLLKCIDVTSSHQFDAIITKKAFKIYEFKFLMEYQVKYGKNKDYESNTDDCLLYKANITLISGDTSLFDVLIDEIQLLDADVCFKASNALKQSNSYKIFGYVLNLHSFSSLSLKLLIVFMISYVFLQRNSWIYLLLVNAFVYVIITHLQRQLSLNSTKSLFINGWNAWSFTGNINQSLLPPIYGLPDVFAKSFHHGSKSLDIHQSSRNSYLIHEKSSYIASDLFCMISSKVSNAGIVIGFLSQKLQFGCVGLNYDYDRIKVCCDCDLVIMKIHVGISTDWLYLSIQDEVYDDPLAVYMIITGKYNNYQHIPTSSVNNAVNDEDNSLSATVTG